MPRVSRSVLFTLITLALVLGIARDASLASDEARPNERQKPTVEHHGSANNQQPQVEPQVPLAAFQSSEIALREAISAIKEQADTAEKYADIQRETWHSPSTKVQLGLLAVGIVYSIFAALQWAAIKEQARIGHVSLAANRHALNAARKSTEAAKQSADAAEKTLSLIERAWVSVQVDEIDLNAIESLRENPAQVTDKFRMMLAVRYKFLNSGKTPARLTRTGVLFKAVVPKELPEPLSYEGGSPRTVLIAPNEPYPLALTLFLDRDTIWNLLGGTKKLTLYGFARYLDALDKPHETRFCMMATFRKGEPPTFGVDGPPSYNYLD